MELPPGYRPYRAPRPPASFPWGKLLLALAIAFVVIGAIASSGSRPGGDRDGCSQSALEAELKRCILRCPDGAQLESCGNRCVASAQAYTLGCRQSGGMIP